MEKKEIIKNEWAYNIYQTLDNSIILHLPTIEFLIKKGEWECLDLFIFYCYVSKLQNNNKRIFATNNWTRKNLKWRKDKLLKAKKQLAEWNIIKTISLKERSSKSGGMVVKKWLIKLMPLLNAPNILNKNLRGSQTSEVPKPQRFPLLTGEDREPLYNSNKYNTIEISCSDSKNPKKIPSLGSKTSSSEIVNRHDLGDEKESSSNIQLQNTDPEEITIEEIGKDIDENGDRLPSKKKKVVRKGKQLLYDKAISYYLKRIKEIFNMEYRVDNQGKWRIALARFFKNPPKGFLLNIKEKDNSDEDDIIAYDFDGEKDVSPNSKGYNKDKIIKFTLRSVMNYYLLNVAKENQPQFWGLITALSSYSINQYLVYCAKLKKDSSIILN